MQQLMFAVKRNRQSVTQGTATVYLNDVEVVIYEDKIKLIDKDELHYGENIGEWASIRPDVDFIKGLLFHPYDEYYKYSNRVKDILMLKNPFRFEVANGIIFMVNKMNEEIEEYFNGCGVEIQEIANGIYYTETIMSVVEFEGLEHVTQVKHVA